MPDDERYNIDPVCYVQISCNRCGHEWEDEMMGICGGDYAYDYRNEPECPNGCWDDEEE